MTRQHVLRRLTAVGAIAVVAAAPALVPAATTATATTADETAPLATVTFAVTGPKETVFNYGDDACATLDLPDAAARAFRDSSGEVHLIATHYQHWASIGSSLNNVGRDCANMIYAAGANPLPETFDNRGWLESFYTLDGDTIHGLVAMDYHPDHYAGLDCSVQDQCWYGTTVQATSTDGGYSFTSPATGTPRFVAGPDVPFDANSPDRVGTFVPSNIVEGPGADPYLYATLSYDRPGSEGHCLIRTLPQNLGNPASWRAWDGTGFGVQFKSPYAAGTQPGDNDCAPVASSLGWPIRSLIRMEGQDLYLAITHGTAIVGGVTKPVVRASTSTDLRTWTTPQTVMELPRYGQFGESCTPELEGQERYQYPSLLDPESTSINFNSTGSTAYVYATAIRYCEGLDRDLVRWPISITVS
ncbi:hypothetical protein [Jiangella alkaliphila]|uniref:DUF4185 domain-containing protein n=1 Tax=Jiangella alkaliphila TaxID=419479 RepID=A0A1H2KR87_9ACTN|nr:hypothetical protein [Jiangella alkaliphila]SDU70876.1 hypothetical protein SAMN04488563_4123 [Jiangella alkaliphila]